MPSTRNHRGRVRKQSGAAKAPRVLGRGACGELRSMSAAGRNATALVRARAETKAARAEASTANARLRSAIDILPQGIVFLDAEGRYILWNQSYAEIYHRSADLFEPGRRLVDTLRIGVARGDYPAAIGREQEWLAERLALLENPGQRHEQWLADGRCILIEERRTSDGGTIGLRVDITEMKAREASFRLLFEANPVPMFVCCRDTLAILAANEAAMQHYGYDRDRLRTMRLCEIHVGQELADLEELGDTSSDAHAGRTWKHRKADGQDIDVAVYARSLTHEGRPALLIAAFDITERKRAEARIAHMTHHDALTGLPNRVQLRARLEETLQRVRRVGGAAAAVLCIDLDNFKGINDGLGHSKGDQLLQQVAQRIRQVLPAGATAARLGGDEFAILVPEIAHAQELTGLADGILNAVAEPYEISGQPILIGASIGIALSPGDGEQTDVLLKNVEIALQRAKADGKGAWRFFEAEMDSCLLERRQLELELRKAMLMGEMEVHYQPMVELASGRICGLEALLRWRHPRRGMVPPSEFIPIAEESGLICALGADVLQRACAEAAGWPGHFKLAVNLSPLQFRGANVFAVVSDALARSGFDPSRLELEITETLLLETSDDILATLHALRELGVGISMDDFGTGYSSLSYLHSFPFDRIKIDRSFVRDLVGNRDAQAIVRAILGLGSSLGITITAEGIETEAELAWLEAAGCGEGQGYLFGRALPGPQMAALLKAQALGRAA